MRIIRRRGWEIAESQVTPESVVLNRRSLIGGAAALLAGGAGRWRAGPASAVPNPNYDAGRALTDEKSATTYNNYYEFSENKNLWRAAQAMKTSPWTIEFAGMVKQPRKIAYDDLLKQVSLEERDLPPSLRRGLGHDRAVDRISDGGTAETRGTFGLREVFGVRDRAGQSDGRAERAAVSMALCRRAGDR